jgi:epoxyqueuosine reductase
MSTDSYLAMGKRIMGCDTCQITCPKNAQIKRIEPPEEMLECMKLEDLLTNPNMEIIARYINPRYMPDKMIKTQAIMAAVNSGRKDLLPLIETLVDSEEETVRKIASWAVAYLGE